MQDTKYVFECGECLSQSDEYDARREAIQAWNIRKKRAGYWIDSSKYRVSKCSECGFEINWDKIDYCDMDIADIKYCPKCGLRLINKDIVDYLSFEDE